MSGTKNGFKVKFDAKIVQKICIFVYLLNDYFLYFTKFRIPGIGLVFLAFGVICQIFFDNGKVSIRKYIMFELAWLVVTAISSLFVAIDYSYVIDTVITMLKGIGIGYIYIRIKDDDKEDDFLAKSWILVSLMLALYTITNGVAVGKFDRVSISEDMNVNTQAVFIMFGIWMSLGMFLNRVKTFKSIVTFVSTNLLFFYTIFLSGSKKAFFGSAFFMAMFIFYFLGPYMKRYIFKRAIAILIAILVSAFVIVVFGNKFLTAFTMLSNRILAMFGENSIDNVRFNLIKDAFNHFLENPLLGLGWNNYRFYSYIGMYSHCTYVEVFACTGIIGGIPATIMILNTIAKVLRGQENQNYSGEHFLMIILLIVMLFIFFVQIVFYNVVLMIIYHIIVEYGSRSGNYNEKILSNCTSIF